MNIFISNFNDDITPDVLLNKIDKFDELLKVRIGIHDCHIFTELDILGFIYEFYQKYKDKLLYGINVDLSIDNCFNFQKILSVEKSFENLSKKIPDLTDLKEYKKLFVKKLFLNLNFSNLPLFEYVDRTLFKCLYKTLRIYNCKKLNYLPSFKNSYVSQINLSKIPITILVDFLYIEKGKDYRDDPSYFPRDNGYSFGREINLKDLPNLENIGNLPLKTATDVGGYLTIENCKSIKIDEIIGKFKRIIITDCNLKKFPKLNYKVLNQLELSENFLTEIPTIKSNRLMRVDFRNNYLTSIDLTHVNFYLNLRYNYISKVILPSIDNVKGARVDLHCNLICDDLERDPNYNSSIDINYYDNTPLNKFNIFIQGNPINAIEVSNSVYANSLNFSDYVNLEFFKKKRLEKHGNNPIILPSVNKLRELSLENIVLMIRENYLTPLELNRAYGPFIYGLFIYGNNPISIENLAQIIFEKVNNEKAFYLKGNDFDNLDLFNYDDVNGNYTNIRFIYKNKKVLTFREIKQLTYLDPSGDVKITNPLYLTIDDVSEEKQEKLYKKYPSQESLNNYFAERNRGIEPILSYSEVHDLYKLITYVIINSNNEEFFKYYFNNVSLLKDYHMTLSNYIANIEKNIIFDAAHNKYQNFSPKIQSEIEEFLWEFFIYTIWSRQWLGWDYQFPLDYKEVCENQVRFMNFRVNKEILDKMYFKLSAQAKSFIDDIPAVYYQWGNTYNIDSNFKNMYEIMYHINKGQCIGIAGIAMISTSYLAICFILLSTNHKLDPDNRENLKNLFNEAFKKYAPRLIRLELEELKSQISDFGKGNKMMLDLYTKDFEKEGFSLEDAKTRAKNKLLAGEEWNFTKHNTRVKRYQDTLKFISSNKEVPTFYPDIEHIANPEHPEPEKL